MAISFLLLEDGDALLLEDGSFMLTEDSGPDERIAELVSAIDPIGMTSAGGLLVSGSSSLSLGEVLLAAAGALPGGGSVIVTLGPITSSSTGHLAITGTGGGAIGPIGLAATGTVEISEGTGSLSVNIAPITITAGGDLNLAGSAAISIGAIALASTGSISNPAERHGALATIIGAISLSASADLAPLPMTALVTLDEAKTHLRILDDDQDFDVVMKIEAASEIVIDYIKRPDHGWTAATAPKLIKAAVLLVAASMFADREFGGLSDSVKNILHRYRDPAVA